MPLQEYVPITVDVVVAELVVDGMVVVEATEVVVEGVLVTIEAVVVVVKAMVVVVEAVIMVVRGYGGGGL